MCIAYASCPCTFRTWNALLIHLNRFHVIKTSRHQSESCIFSCHLCLCKDLVSERDYWAHINAHLKKNDVVTCMFLDCNFQTNIFGTFKSHKSRKHNSYSLTDFKPEIVTSTTFVSLESAVNTSDDDIGEGYSDAQSDSSVDAPKDLPDVIEHTFAAALLKLEHFSHVPSTAINDFLLELHHLTGCLLRSHTDGVLIDIFQKYKLQVDRAIIEEITSSLCTRNPINKAIEKGGPLSSAYPCKQY